jgi:hypothetical protein
MISMKTVLGKQMQMSEYDVRDVRGPQAVRGEAVEHRAAGGAHHVVVAQAQVDEHCPVAVVVADEEAAHRAFEHAFFVQEVAVRLPGGLVALTKERCGGPVPEGRVDDRLDLHRTNSH